MPPVNWLSGWVQLWFSMAMTKTVLSSSALAGDWPSVIKKAKADNMRRRLRCGIWSSIYVEDVRRAQNPIDPSAWSDDQPCAPDIRITVLPKPEMNARLLF